MNGSRSKGSQWLNGYRRYGVELHDEKAKLHVDRPFALRGINLDVPKGKFNVQAHYANAFKVRLFVLLEGWGQENLLCWGP